MLNITPKHAQQVGLQQLRESWKQYKSFMIYAPVGSGKTGLAAFITDGFINRGMRVLFIAPYTVLIEQTAERFVEYGIDGNEIGYIWRDHPNYNPHAQVQIASADTLIRREMPDCDVVFIDEAHLRRKTILEALKGHRAKVIGLSGTPFAPFLGQFYQKLIKPVTMKELIENGDLSDYEFFAPTKPNLQGVKTVQGDYEESAIAEIMGDSDLVGNIVQNWLTNGQDLPTVAFCVNVAHANHVMLSFNKAQVSAEVMAADTPHDERQFIIKRFERGDTKIIVNVGVLVAGFDSDVRCIIYARPTQSEMRWIQCLGRGLRPAIGKDKCIIFDHSGTVHRLGFPDDIEYDYLPNDKKALREYQQRQQQERKEKEPKECTSCNYMKPVGVHTCPKCGFAPVRHADVDVDETRNLEKVVGKVKKYNSEEKQRFYSELVGYRNFIRETKGKEYSKGWLAHTYKDKFGVWPRNINERIAIAPSQETLNFIKAKMIRNAKGKERRAAA